MNKQQKKMVAPIAVSVIFIVYYLVYFAVLIALLNGFWKYLFGIVPIALAALMVAVCFDRIKEIRSGEEDDLSKY